MKNNIKIKLLGLGLLIAVTTALTGCYTVHGAVTGAGRDVNTLFYGSPGYYHTHYYYVRH